MWRKRRCHIKCRATQYISDDIGGLFTDGEVIGGLIIDGEDIGELIVAVVLLGLV